MATQPPVSDPASADITGGILTRMRAVLDERAAAQAPATEPPASQETVAEPEPESPSEPVAVQPDAPAAEGSTPAEPTPASEVLTTSAVEALSKRGIEIKDEKAAAEYLRIESELAARVRAEKKATKVQPAADPQPAPQQAAPEPTPATRPVQVQPARPEPPAAAVEPAQDIEQVLAQHVNRDSVCVGLSTKLTAIEAELANTGKVDEDGNIVGGALARMADDLAQLELALKPPAEALKKFGVEIPQLDEVSRERIQMQATALELKLQRGIQYVTGRQKLAEKLVRDFAAREGQYRSHFESQHKERSEAAQRDAEIDARADEVVKEWESESAKALKAHNVPPEYHARIQKVLKREGKAHPGAIEDIPSFISKVVADEWKDIDEIHRAKSRSYAVEKKALNESATPGPKGPAAVAPPAKQNHGSISENLAAKAKALMANR